jgi:acetolactate synthase small subunit
MARRVIPTWVYDAIAEVEEGKEAMLLTCDQARVQRQIRKQKQKGQVGVHFLVDRTLREYATHEALSMKVTLSAYLREEVRKLAEKWIART